MRPLSLVTAILCLALSLSLAQAASDTTSAQPAPEGVAGAATPGLPELSLPSPLGTGCDATVGILGSYFEPEITDFLTANGLTVVSLSGASIAAGALDSLSTLYITRWGESEASSQAPVIDAWIRAGGRALSEYTASRLWYDGGAFDYLDGSFVMSGYTPSGNFCGNNTLVVNLPDHGLAVDLPPAWDCSGDPQGVYTIYSGIDPRLCVVVSLFGEDVDGDGIDEPSVASFDVDLGSVTIFYSDFGDWTDLEDPRTACTACNRSVEDETLLLNAVCRGHGCEPASSPCADCETVHATIDDMEIDREGIRQSLHSQLDAACRALDRGQLRTAGNILCALLNHDEAQDRWGNENKHVAHESAVALEECVRAFAEANDIPLRSPNEHCGTVLESEGEEI